MHNEYFFVFTLLHAQFIFFYLSKYKNLIFKKVVQA